MSEWQTTETAPATDVIIMDLHGFVYRAKRYSGARRDDWIQNGWVVHGSIMPVFNDDELTGWMLLPEPTEKP